MRNCKTCAQRNEEKKQKIARKESKTRIKNYAINTSMSIDSEKHNENKGESNYYSTLYNSNQRFAESRRILEERGKIAPIKPPYSPDWSEDTYSNRIDKSPIFGANKSCMAKPFLSRELAKGIPNENRKYRSTI